MSNYFYYNVVQQNPDIVEQFKFVSMRINRNGQYSSIQYVYTNKYSYYCYCELVKFNIVKTFILYVFFIYSLAWDESHNYLFYKSLVEKHFILFISRYIIKYFVYLGRLLQFQF